MDQNKIVDSSWGGGQMILGSHEWPHCRWDSWGHSHPPSLHLLPTFPPPRDASSQQEDSLHQRTTNQLSWGGEKTNKQPYSFAQEAFQLTPVLISRRTFLLYLDEHTLTDVSLKAVLGRPRKYISNGSLILSGQGRSIPPGLATKTLPQHLGTNSQTTVATDLAESLKLVYPLCTLHSSHLEITYGRGFSWPGILTQRHVTDRLLVVPPEPAALPLWLQSTICNSIHALWLPTFPRKFPSLSIWTSGISPERLV